MHWLPIKFRIDYKICLQTYKILSVGEPSYLSQIINYYVPLRALRSSGDGTRIEIPFSKTAMAARAFSIQASRLWNVLPAKLRNSVIPDHQGVKSKTIVQIDMFKKMLKTRYFSLAFVDRAV